MNIYKFDTVDSTNTIAIKMAEDNFPVPYIITADFQTHGRGKRHKVWHSKPCESLLMSVALECEREVWLYSFTAGAAVSKVLEKHGFHIKLKWVNDLILDDKKLGGILCEVCRSHNTKKIIIGIGINLSASDFPEEIRGFSTSLCLNTPSFYIDREVLASEIAEEIMLLSKKENIISLWKDKIWGIGNPVTVEIGESPNLRIVEGIMEGVSDKGELEILSDGEIKIISAGSIVY